MLELRTWDGINPAVTGFWHLYQCFPLKWWHLDSSGRGSQDLKHTDMTQHTCKGNVSLASSFPLFPASEQLLQFYFSSYANCGLWVNFCQLPCFVNKALLKHTCSFVYTFSMAQLSSKGTNWISWHLKTFSVYMYIGIYVCVCTHTHTHTHIYIYVPKSRS